MFLRFPPGGNVGEVTFVEMTQVELEEFWFRTVSERTREDGLEIGDDDNETFESNNETEASYVSETREEDMLLQVHDEPITQTVVVTFVDDNKSNLINYDVA